MNSEEFDIKFRYPAIKINQTNSDKPVILFGASALEIDQWAGVPQKKKFDNTAETTGFQREFNKKRLEDLQRFFSDPENIIQNPLLCSTRSTSAGIATFEPMETEGSESKNFQIGTLCIGQKDYSHSKLVEVLSDLRDQLEERMPDLKGRTPRATLLESLKQLVTENGEESIENESNESNNEEAQDEDETADMEGVLFEESHIADFWTHVAARHEILKELGEDFEHEELLGFTKEAVVAFLKPIVLVDGQHRLIGSLETLRNENEEHKDEIEELLKNGKSPDEATSIVRTKNARRLPVSLILTESPAEQVFQFVIVNQKATPIGKPLLGTIVSTTLTNDEMSGVAERLRNAGIDLEEAQAITWLARNPESPFFNKVERGLTADPKDLLPWTVLGSLVRIFRELNGGTLFGQTNDYAASWRARYLENSKIVENWNDHGYDNPMQYWSKLNGPWRDVFCKFFNCIKSKFAQDDSPERGNYWGSPRSSNLFNKISLTILSADFFQALTEMKRTIGSTDDIQDLVDLWLEDVSPQYFDRDWQLAGVKKDSVGIRNQWAQLWYEYRKVPNQLPDYRNYRKIK